MNPKLAALQSVLGLRNQLSQHLPGQVKTPPAPTPPRTLQSSVTDLNSRDSNSSAEDSGQFSPGEKKEKSPTVGPTMLPNLPKPLLDLQNIGKLGFQPNMIGEAMKNLLLQQNIQQRMAEVSRLQEDAKRKREETTEE